ncbi:uncharacterized protein LY89DRAFT_679786 [Mollisia scopiformis]|uniref:Uncharacterized protein n=1 Tax=Mollisia scopiformis TaxID=149040 RepID=A0A194XTD5_MOLSC|nr:uncharacterized protein LY89DRAFT_679786 [Mollisia scopiformis]KUJ22957.1 hypothetical protein LY89DRAFT_679786 [Mollisia scopiformis]
MSSKPASPLRQAWYRWKSLKLPWRKRFLVGLDLQGNTFWEFRDTLSSHQHRMRRIVQYPSTTQYSEIRISPQWHQWLRHTRKDPPSLTEQSQDLVRQRNLKVLAAEADARWAAKPSFLDTPERSQPLPTLELKDQGGYTQSAESEDEKDVRSAISGGLEDIPQTPTETLKPAEVESEVKSKIRENTTQDTSRRHETSKPVTEPADDPWKQARGGPSEGWQPKAWDGNLAATRR